MHTLNTHRQLPAKFKMRSLKLVWQVAPHTERFIVGTILRSSDGLISFEYDGQDIDRAQKKGFTGYGFSRSRPAPAGKLALEMFASRLPPKSRPDRADLLGIWGVDVSETDPLFLLGATGGRLPTDSFEFIPNIEPLVGTCVYSEIAGFTHASDGDALKSLELETTFKLKPDVSNEFDPFAVEIRYKELHIGYVKKVLNASVLEAMKSGLQVNCKLVSKETNGVVRRAIIQLTFN